MLLEGGEGGEGVVLACVGQRDGIELRGGAVPFLFTPAVGVEIDVAEGEEGTFFELYVGSQAGTAQEVDCLGCEVGFVGT